MLQGWMEQRLQQWQTKQCFRPGWNEDFNNSRQKSQQKNPWFKPYIDGNETPATSEKTILRPRLNGSFIAERM
jgi:hypothetical protein